MPREQLQLLSADVNRLLAAGASVAAGDEGLRKRSRMLRDLGQKVPVLNQIADAVERVVNAAPKQATPALLDLALVVRQVRASLAGAGTDGAVEALPSSGPWQSPAPLRALEGWLDSLASSDYQRTRVLKKALARPEFPDVRLVGPLQRTLGSSHYGLARLVANKALPAFGKSVLPELEAAFDLAKGKAVDAHRLEAICAIDPEKGAALCRQGLADGSAPVKVQALRSLSRIKPEETEKAALLLLGQKVPDEVHIAAYYALATGKTDAALDALMTCLVGGKGTFHCTIENSLQKFEHPRATQRVLDEVDKALQDLEERQAKDKARRNAARGKKKVTLTKAQQKEAEKEQRLLSESADRVYRLLRVLGGRKDSKAIPKLVSLLQHADSGVRETAGNALIRLGDRKGLEAVADLIDDKNLWGLAIQAAWTMSPKERFDRLAPALAKLSTARAADRYRGERVLNLFTSELHFLNPDEDEYDDDEYDEDEDEYDDDEYDDPYAYDEDDNFDDEDDEPSKPTAEWDPRWVPALRKHLNGPQRQNVAQALAVLLHDKAIPELVKILPASAAKNEYGVIGALGVLRAKEAAKPLTELLTKKGSLIYPIQHALRQIGDFSILPALEELVKKTKDSYRKQYLESLIEYLEKAAKQAKA